MAGRASIVGAAATHVGKVRDHNEDAHFIDVDLGLFLVCDGMGGHAAGEVASAIAIRSIRDEWSSAGLHEVARRWLERGTPEAKKRLLDVVRAGVVAAHASILAEAERDESKSGMGTTLVGAVIVGSELVFAHAGDSRAYLVRDGISMQLTEDHTLLARLLAAGIDVDVSGEGSRFRSMLTNALGIGEEVKVSTFVVPLAAGDRFLLCSDGISEYVPENEVGDVLTRQANPSRAAERLIELALERGGGDNATAVVVGVVEAGESQVTAAQRNKDDVAISACALWGKRVTPQQRLRALRISIPRDHGRGEKLPAHTLGDRVAWIIVEGELLQDGRALGPGALVYPESLLSTREPAPPPDRDALAVAQSEVRALAIRADDFRELCDDDSELGEALLESLAQLIASRQLRPQVRLAGPPIDPRASTDPHLPVVSSRGLAEVTADPANDREARSRAATIPGEPDPGLLASTGATSNVHVRPRPAAESATIAPAPPRQPPARPSPLPAGLTRRPAPPAPPAPPAVSVPSAPTRPSPLPAHLTPAHPSSPPPAPAAPAAAAPSGKPTQGPTPAQATAAAALPRTPTPAHGIPKMKPVGGPARATPASGVPTPVRPMAAVTTVAGRDDEFATLVDGESPWDPVRPARLAQTRTAPREPEPAEARTRALTPPGGAPLEEAGARRDSSDPEIETFFEMEAELPPQDGGSDLSAELAFGLSLGGDLDDEHASVSITIEEDRTRVIERVTETSAHTLTVTVTESAEVERAITSEDGSEVSGRITIPDEPSAPPRRARRPSQHRGD